MNSASYGVFTRHLFSAFDHFGVLLMINFVITLSKFTAEPFACSLWFYSHFDHGHVMMQFFINKRKDTKS